MDQDIQVYYTELNRPLKQACFDFYSRQLPPAEQERIGNYKRYEDRLAALSGKALLMAGMKEMGGTADWARLKRNAFGKPYLEGAAGIADFNISHSGSYAVAVISRRSAVGIDVEARRPLDIDDFENCFSREEWLTIRESGNALSRFFDCWSIKEAVIKAAGKGLSIPLPDVRVMPEYAAIGTEQYSYKKLELHKDYSLVVAAQQALHAIIPRNLTHLFDWE